MNSIEENATIIAKAIAEELRNTVVIIDPEVHSKHHQFIDAYMEELATRRARRQKIQDTVTGSLILSGVLATLSALGWLGKLVLETLRIKHGG